ncbi:hypothetical protein LJC63_03810 [Ruminococcaceae bacterium OttesenSCG-928-L11]|nr:hypothetical protein [Ruminococcaceae bacterium OttesenSCG-928-L11]
MKKYGILANPGHNRVYFDASRAMASSELAILAEGLGLPVAEPREERIGGVPYLTFQTDADASVRQRDALWRASFAYAIFEVREAGGETLLKPLEKPPEPPLGTGLSTILKYTGKTNELFTRMLIQIGRCSCRWQEDERLYLLDPVAGKGTTLFEGLMAGLDVAGIEIGGKAVQESCGYFRKYLETMRFKHTVTKESMSGERKQFRARINRFAVAPDKESFKDDRRRQTFVLAEANSQYADKLFPKNTFHLLVGDLPYGVAHGNVSNEKQSSLTRNPSELLAACLPAWRAVMKPGATLVLAWNSYVLSREDMRAILEQHGLTVLRGGPYDGFEHMVDRSIRRDVVVAVKPKGNSAAK